MVILCEDLETLWSGRYERGSVCTNGKMVWYCLYRLRFEARGNEPRSARTAKFLEGVAGVGVTTNQKANGDRL